MADYITTLLDDNEVDTLSPTTTIPAIRDANGNYLDNTLAASDLNAAKNGKILDLVNNKVNKSDIADNLTTNDSTKVLSAKQGKILNDSINAINVSITVDPNVVTNGSVICQKCGKIALVFFASIKFASVGMSQRVATGLPTNRSGVYASIFLFGDGGTGGLSGQVYIPPYSDVLFAHVSSTSEFGMGVLVYTTE